MTSGELPSYYSDLVFNPHKTTSWFYNKYYRCGGNFRYPTFSLALNVLAQTRRNPVIVETGCQRLKEDIGGGMSTSIFGEFVTRYGGHLYTVDNTPNHLATCRSVTSEWKGSVTYVLSDSVLFLRDPSPPLKGVDLLYLDSYDYPYGAILDCYGGQTDINQAITTVGEMTDQEVLLAHSDVILPCQEHCLRELKSAIDSGLLGRKTILLIDDNQWPGGGKSRLAKEFLGSQYPGKQRWVCLLDGQQTIWMAQGAAL